MWEGKVEKDRGGRDDNMAALAGVVARGNPETQGRMGHRSSAQTSSLYSTEKLRFEPARVTQLHPECSAVPLLARLGTTSLQGSHECFLLPDAATARRMHRALRTLATVSPVSQDGMGPCARSLAHQAPLARAATNSAPTAGVGSPVT